MSKITFRIDLEYNQTDFEFMTGESFETEADFIEAAGEYAIEDLTALWREFSSVKDFSEIIISEEDN
jgi:hypothetical protein